MFINSSANSLTRGGVLRLTAVVYKAPLFSRSEPKPRYMKGKPMVTTATGVLVILLGLICWLGQTLVVVAPDVAIKIGVGEPEEEIDRSMYLFERYSQGIMDILLTWMLPAAALMMLIDVKQWPLFALVGGGVYLYFPGVFIITRIVLQKDGKMIGKPASARTAYVLGVLWALSAIFMIAMAVAELTPL